MILISLALRLLTGFDAGQEAIRRLSIIVTYAMSITVFMIMAEFFTAFYSQVPSHMYALKYFFVGLYGGNSFVLISWIFAVLCLLALILLLNPKTRGDEKWLTIACASTFIALAIEKEFPLRWVDSSPIPSAGSPSTGRLRLNLASWSEYGRWVHFCLACSIVCSSQ